MNTAGGVSMGAKDLIKPMLEEMGSIFFGKVRMKPGKPLTFATVNHNDRRVLIFALPGKSLKFVRSSVRNKANNRF